MRLRCMSALKGALPDDCMPCNFVSTQHRLIKTQAQAQFCNQRLIGARSASGAPGPRGQACPVSAGPAAGLVANLSRHHGETAEKQTRAREERATARQILEGA